MIIALAFFLRVYKVAQFPPGLYSDETAYGYNAYSLLKTGRDEYGKPWPLTFKSFGDYKPPMTAWLTIPSIAVFGLNEFAVRLPSVIAGTVTVAIIYFLTKELFPRKGLKIGTWKLRIEEIASFLLAISPWHLHFSRSSMLVGIEAMFISAGVLFFLKGLKQPKVLYLSAVSFVAAIYTYYGSRITVPLLLIALTIIFKQKLWKMRRVVLGSAILGALLMSPLFATMINDPAALTGRAQTISIFYDSAINSQLWRAHTLDGPEFPVLISRFFHNKAYFYFRDFARRYLHHFSYDFWIRTGDTSPPFDIPNQGVIYGADTFFLLLGFYLAIRIRSQKSQALLAYLLLSPVVAALTFITPAANRSFNLIIPLTILVALGLVHSFSWLRQKMTPNLLRHNTLYALVILVYIFSFTRYLRHYYVAIPQEIPHEWHYGRKELVQKVSALENEFDHVVFSNKEGPAYIWLLFYKQYPPQKYWQTAKVDQVLNEFGWLHVETFAKYIFPRQFDWQTLTKQPNVLYVGYEDQIPDDWIGNVNDRGYALVVDDKVLYPNGNTAFKLVHLEER